MTQPTAALDRKSKMKIPHQPIAQRPVAERVRDFDEIYIEYTPEQAITEASRCLLCPDPKCVEACPLHNNIPEAMQKIAQGDFLGAAAIYHQTSPFPEICSRVCPHERLCEGACVVGKRGEPIACGHLEVFVTDYERAQHGIPIPPGGLRTGYRVAIVGAGPASLACAQKLNEFGHTVDVFEALPEAGGLLMYGIPRFKLSRSVVSARIAAVERSSVSIFRLKRIGRDLTIDELLSIYDAVFIATGTLIDKPVKTPGDDLQGIYNATDFLIRGNLDTALWPAPEKGPLVVGQKVAVIGGGDTAMDCLRTALRIGAQAVTCLYRRTEAEMPGNARERKNAIAEGARFEYLVAPVKFLGDGNGHVRTVVCLRMELGEPDSSGRRRPVPVPGSEFEFEADTVVLALGYEGDPLIPESTPGLTTKWNLIQADPATGQTSRAGVFAGGDVVTGPDLVSTAAASGLRAAAAIDQYLKRLPRGEERVAIEEAQRAIQSAFEWWRPSPRRAYGQAKGEDT